MTDPLLARSAAAVVVLALVTLAAVARRHARPYAAPPGATVPRDLLASPTATATHGAPPMHVLYFTSRLCGECAETPRLLEQAAPGVPVRALPVERHAALAQRLGVVETPTLLVVDDEGRVRWAHAGNPPASALRAALDAAAQRSLAARAPGAAPPARQDTTA